MRQWIGIIALGLLCAPQSFALYTVNGTGGAANTYATLQEAVTAALGSGETQIEVAANGPLAGFALEGAAPAGGLTIGAKSGFTPAINSTISINHANAVTVTLQGLTVTAATDTDALEVGPNSVTVLNCTLTASGIPDTKAIDANLGTPGDAGTLTVQTSTLQGPFGIDFISPRNLVLNGSTITVIARQPCIGTDAGRSQNRTLNVSNSVLHVATADNQGGMGIRHPYGPGDPATQPQGPATVTNCLIMGTDQANNYVNVFSNGAQAVLRHCTFKNSPENTAPTDAVMIGMRAQAVQSHVTIVNCLFDMPEAGQQLPIIVPQGADVVVDGNANVYNVPNGMGYTERTGSSPFTYTPKTKFEATAYYPATFQQGVYLTDSEGHLTAEGRTLALDKAVALTPAVTVDREGDARPEGAASDIGADEYVVVNQVRGWTLMD